MNDYITINGRRIGPSYPPYIIAELSANHNGDINRAYQIMEAAKKAGADAIKLQTYTPDTITVDSSNDDFMINDGLWKGQSLYELYSDAFMPWDWHEKLFKKAKELNLTIFSSPFDDSAVELLESLDTPAYKIASFEAIDLPLIRKVASTGKPLIISTGMANLEEIGEAIDTAISNGCKELVVLHCVSGYPAPADEYNLKTISDMSERFSVLTGLSDHTIDNATALASVALGASVIEKHVTLDRDGGGADDSFSIEPLELEALCRDVKTVWSAIGKPNYSRTAAEKGNVKFRRSVYVVDDVKCGETFDKNNLRSIRPGYGLEPKHLDSVLGKKATRDIPKNTALDWNMIDV